MEFIPGIPATATGRFVLDPEEAWDEPFGIPDTELRKLALEVDFTSPLLTGLGFIGEYRFGNYNLDSAFFYDITDLKKNAKQLTARTPIPLVDLWLGPVNSYILNQVGKEVKIVNDFMTLVDKILDADVVSIDTDGDGKLDPLFQFVPFDGLTVAGEPIPAGLGVAGKGKIFGREAELIANLNPGFSSFNGSLTTDRIDLGKLGLVVIEGANNSDLDLDITLNNNNKSISGDVGIEVFGFDLANASFDVGLNGIEIGGKVSIASFGQANLDLDLNVNSNKLDIKGKFDVNLPKIKVDLGPFNKSFNLGSFGVTTALSGKPKSNSITGSLKDINFKVFGLKVGSFDLSLGSGDSIDSWNDILGEIKSSVIRKAISKGKKAFADAINAALDAVDDVGKSVGLWGYLDGATAWFDTNNNGLFEPEEPNAITNSEGFYLLDIPDRFDLSSGIVRLTGGVDTATGLPIQGVMSASSRGIISPLTSLIQGLIEDGLSETEAQESIRNAFGIASTVDLFDFNYVDEAINGNSDARAVLLASNTVQGIISGVHNLLAGAAGGTIDSQDASVDFILSNSAYSTLAELINGNSFDVEDATQIEAVIRDTATTAETLAQEQGVTLEIDNTLIDEVANEAAQLLAAGATKKRLLSEESADGIELFTKITQAKFVSHGEEATALNEFAQGNVSATEILELADTSEAALQAIREVNLKPQLAGIFDLNLTDGQEIIGLPITLFDFETPYEQLDITITSDNSALLPTENVSIVAGSNPQEALLSVSPLAGEIGEATININVEDSDGNSLSEDFTVSVETDLAPVFSETPETTLLTPRDSELGLVVADLNANDGNGGDRDLSVSYSILEGNDLDGDNLEPFIINIDGEIVVNDVDDLVLADPVTPFNLTVEANDGTLTTQTDVAIRVDDPPTAIDPLTDRNFKIGQPLNFQLDSDRFDDANQDNLTYTATLADGSELPNWLDFNPDTRTFSSNANPNTEDLGILEIQVTARDNRYSVSDSFSLAIVNRVVDDTTEQQGSDGDDAVAGGTGQDTVRGGKGDDVVSGDLGNDRLFGDLGNDRLLGGEGSDRLNGGDGNDEIDGGAGRDKLSGGEGNDTLFGREGQDRLSGNSGDDLLDGGTENDYLQGGEGNDTLYGGAGSDKLRGNEGSDIFVLMSGNVGNTIIDYVDGTDKLGLELSSFSDNTVEDIFNNELSVDYSNGNAEIFANFGDDLLATLLNVDANSITVEDFTAF